MSKIKIATLQMTSRLDYVENLKKIENFLQEAQSKNVTHVFLPEVFYSMSDGSRPTPFLIDGQNEHYRNIQNLSSKYKLFLLGGSAATKLGDKITNRSYNFSPDGKDLGHYDKQHLFSCEIIKDGELKKIDEGIIYSAGKENKIIQAGPLNIGLSICFDLRFPQLYQEYARSSANLISISSAFTVPTGLAHWHTLVRARAIETQLFVVACGQWGSHNERMQTFGHSLIVSPWGEVMSDAGEGEKLSVVEIDLGQIEKVRKAVKVF